MTRINPLQAAAIALALGDVADLPRLSPIQRKQRAPLSPSASPKSKKRQVAKMKRIAQRNARRATRKAER